MIETINYRRVQFFMVQNPAYKPAFLAGCSIALVRWNKQGPPSLKLRWTREESPDNTGHHASEREDVCEGIVAEKKITAGLSFLAS